MLNNKTNTILFNSSRSFVFTIASGIKQRRAEQFILFGFFYFINFQNKLAMTNKNLPGLNQQQTKTFFSDLFYFILILAMLFFAWFHFSNF